MQSWLTDYRCIGDGWQFIDDFTGRHVLDVMDKLKFLVGIMLCLFSSCAVQKQGLTILDRSVTMKVYSAEILESVINRLCIDSMQDIKFSSTMLLPYRAKARDYKDKTVKSILDDQLGDTPIRYQLTKKGLILYNTVTGDYSTNRLSAIKR